MKLFSLIMCMKVIEKILKKICKFQKKKLKFKYKNKKKLKKRKNKEFMEVWKKRLYKNKRMR